MRGPSASSSTSTMSFKQAFLKNLLLGLQDCSRRTKPLRAMSLHERKQAVKSSADIAMAAAHGGGARWPKVIILQPPAALPTTTTTTVAAKAQRCRRIVRRCCGQKRRSGGLRSAAAAAAAGGGGVTIGGEMARKLVRRTMALRKVIPGGDAMDEASLLREAMDYVVHLRAQVDVLRRVSEAVQRRSTPLRDSGSHCAFTEKEDSSMRG